MSDNPRPYTQAGTVEVLTWDLSREPTDMVVSLGRHHPVIIDIGEHFGNPIRLTIRRCSSGFRIQCSDPVDLRLGTSNVFDVLPRLEPDRER